MNGMIRARITVGAAKYRHGPEATEATARVAVVVVVVLVMVLAVVATVAVVAVAVVAVELAGGYGRQPSECALAATRSSTITVASYNAYK